MARDKAKNNDIEYKVLLVMPDHENMNARNIMEKTLFGLNNFRDIPGWRFAPNVTATLDVASNSEEAMNKIQGNLNVAAVVINGMPEDELGKFIGECHARSISVIKTSPSKEDDFDEKTGQPHPVKYGLKRRQDDEDRRVLISVPEHVLINPLADEDTLNNVTAELHPAIAMAVMMHHHVKQEAYKGIV